MTTNATSLRGVVDGAVLEAGDDGYDEACAIWNAMIERKPRLIVRCVSARDNDLEIGVRCGGHGILGSAVPDDGLMIDLTPLNAVRVDSQARRARVRGGALLGLLDQAAQEHRLATTAGNVSHTGVGGLTLGGGMGWLARQYGLTCDNVVSFEVVTADARTVCASATENPELYWGLRGGGGNFGVVTDFEFVLHPVAGQTIVADFWFGLDTAPDVFRLWRDLNAEAPREATFTASVTEKDGQPMASVGLVWVGPPDAGRAYVPALRALGKPLSERVIELSYVDLQRMDDNVMGHRFRRYWKGHYLQSLPDEAIEAFLLRGTGDGSGQHLPNASLQAYGGAIAEVPDGDTAFSQRNTLFEFVTAARWDDPAEDESRMAAARRYATSLDPFASGAYVNVLTDEGQAGVQRAYPPDKLARLTRLKDQWDPDNVFHLNQNIRPSGDQ